MRHNASLPGCLPLAPTPWPALTLCIGLALAGSARAQATPAPSPGVPSPAALTTTAPPAAGTPKPQAATTGQVVVAGMVPDDASRQAILARVRELYGSDKVVDQLGVGPQVAPPNWSAQVQKLLQNDIKQVRRGQISIQGNVIELKGEVDSDSTRQQLITQMAGRLNNPTYTIRNGLRVSAAGQEVVDAALANRTIEFEPGSATLTASGVAVLEQVAPILQQLSGRRFEVIGHTDALGARAANVTLSAARAEVVKGYLVRKGLAETMFSSSGVGPDRPVADNSTAEGRARNRRIEIRVSQ